MKSLPIGLWTGRAVSRARPQVGGRGGWGRLAPARAALKRALSYLRNSWLSRRELDKRILWTLAGARREMTGVELRQIVRVSYGRLYCALDRLEQEGRIASRSGGVPVPERGGRPRWYYRYVRSAA